MMYYVDGDWRDAFVIVSHDNDNNNFKVWIANMVIVLNLFKHY